MLTRNINKLVARPHRVRLFKQLSDPLTIRSSNLSVNYYSSQSSSSSIDRPSCFNSLLSKSINLIDINKPNFNSTLVPRYTTRVL